MNQQKEEHCQGCLALPHARGCKCSCSKCSPTRESLRRKEYLNKAKLFLDDGSGHFADLLVTGMELTYKSVQETALVLEVDTSTILTWIEGDLAPLNKVQEFAIKYMVQELAILWAKEDSIKEIDHFIGIDTFKEVCIKCYGMGILPNRMEEEDGPVCACGKPSRLQSGHCGEEHGKIYCDCALKI